MPLLVVVLEACLVAAAGCGGAAVRSSHGTRVPSTATSSVSCVKAGSCSVGGATKVSGLAHRSDMSSISCGAAGSCVAGGDFSSKGSRAFLVDERNGVWGKPVEVRGPATPNGLGPISCAAPGSCAAGGWYGGGNRSDAFLVNETRGVWGKAVAVRGANVSALSCASAGFCTAGGSFHGRRGNLRAFVVNEKHGVWGKPIEVPGLAALNAVGGAEVNSISCPTDDSCAAGGVYIEGSDGEPQRAFVVNETHGVWGRAVRVDSPAIAFNDPELSTMSCATPDFCAAGGSYDDGYGQRAFVVSERDGVWGHAIRVPGRRGRGGEVTSVSCDTAEFCAAIGDFDGVAFVANSVNGAWQKAVEVKGPTGRDVRGTGSISCASAGACTAAISGDSPAYYGNEAMTVPLARAFVVGERHGIWGTAVVLPGAAALGTSITVSEIACPTARRCAVAGSYAHGRGAPRALVTAPTS